MVEAADINPDYQSQIEIGKRSGLLRTLIAIIMALGVDFWI